MKKRTLYVQPGETIEIIGEDGVVVHVERLDEESNQTAVYAWPSEEAQRTGQLPSLWTPSDGEVLNTNNQ